MNINSVVQDAISLAKTSAQDARDAAVAGLTHISADAEAAVPKITQDASANVIEFVPQRYRPFVQPFLSGIVAGSLAKVDDAAVAGIKIGLGWAVQRIDALKF